jgi:hypothetical protein
MDALISYVYRALQKGTTIDAINEALLAKGWASDDIFLGIRAGQNLHNAMIEQDRKLFRERAWAHYNPKPAPFGRSGTVRREVR